MIFATVIFIVIENGGNCNRLSANFRRKSNSFAAAWRIAAFIFIVSNRMEVKERLKQERACSLLKEQALCIFQILSLKSVETDSERFLILSAIAL
jgi:hypothetical protein